MVLFHSRILSQTRDNISGFLQHRVYQLGGEDGVDKLLETERHQDRVDSIQWCHRGLMFVSGSRDGTALIWYYECQQWKNIILNMANVLPG